MTIRIFFTVVLLLVLGQIGTVRADVPDGTNIAPLSPYTITPNPNYDLATGTRDKVLTDGRRASGRFWTGRDSIGWYWQSPIVYRQTLAPAPAVRRVEIGTGQNLRSEVGLPANAFVFGRDAAGHWVYLGDAAEHPDAAGDGVRTLSLEFAPVALEAVAVVIYRSQPYVTLDEVRVIAASAAAVALPRAFVADIMAHAEIRRRVTAATRAGTAPLGEDPAARFAWPLPAANIPQASCTVTQISPWTESDPDAIATAPATSAADLNATGGWLSTALRIDNTSSDPLRLDMQPAATSGTGPLDTFSATYVLALDYRWRADVLVPAKTLILPPHSRTLVIGRAPVLAPGPLAAGLHVTCGGQRSDIVITGRAVAITPEDRPYANAWSYLRGPSRNLARCGTKVQDDAWIDTAVIDASALAPKRTAAGNAELRSYLRVFARARRLLLFMDMTDTAWAPDTSPDLERQLTVWWSAVSQIIAEAGYKGEVLFYPVDEVSEAQLPRQTAAARVLRRIAPGVQIYATITNLAAANGADADVKQFHDRILPRLPAGTPLGRSPQIYATGQYSKTLGLSDYYRRQGWLAFGAGWQGAGLWALWDGNGADQPTAGWTDFGGIERDYNLIYSDSSGCPLASRRLLAFQRGLEDFAVLAACRRTNGGRTIDAGARLAAPAGEAARKDALAFDAALVRLTAPCGADKQGPG